MKNFVLINIPTYTLTQRVVPVPQETRGTYSKEKKYPFYGLTEQ